VNLLEVVFISEKAAFEECQTNLEETRIVFSLKYRIANVANQVLKE